MIWRAALLASVALILSVTLGCQTILDLQRPPPPGPERNLWKELFP